MAYLMPDFQNPTARSMDARERDAFLTAAERAGSVLVLDETTADLDIDRGPVPAGFGSADPSSVVRIGSLGKTVWGGLRVGWIRAEGDLVRRFVAARPAHDLGTPEFEQAVASSLFEDFAVIAAQRSELLRGGRDALANALRRHLPSWRIPHAPGGVSLWIELDAPLSSALVMDVRSRGVLLSAGPRFSVDGGHDRHLRVPFTAPPDDAVRAAELLAESWRQVKAGAPITLIEQFESVV
jgi:DNA-binding transcriptional MocR family regulator